MNLCSLIMINIRFYCFYIQCCINMYTLYNVYMHHLISLVIGYTADKGPVSNVSHYIHVYMILGFNYGHNEYRLFNIVHVLVTTKTRTSLRTIYKFTTIKYHPYHKVLPNAEDSHRHIQPLNC